MRVLVCIIFIMPEAVKRDAGPVTEVLLPVSVCFEVCFQLHVCRVEIIVGTDVVYVVVFCTACEDA